MYSMVLEASIVTHGIPDVLVLHLVTPICKLPFPLSLELCKDHNTYITTLGKDD